MKDTTKVWLFMLFILLAGVTIGWTVNDLTTQLYCWEDYTAKMSRCITVP